MNKPTTDPTQRELVGVVNKLHKEARVASGPERELAGDLAAILNHVMFDGRVPTPNRLASRRF